MEKETGTRMKFRFSLKTLFVLITLIGVWLGWRKYVEAESASVLRAYHSVMTLLEAGDFNQAYLLMTDDYRASHSFQEFEVEFSQYSRPGNPPHNPNASVNSLFLFEAEVYWCEAPGFLDLLSGPSYKFRREHGEWRFTGDSQWYYD
jgi:hypothetical protein